MSNRTAKGAKTLHGQDPQLLIEKITRERIYSCRYWKEKCFGLASDSLIDRALELKAVGGTFGAQQKPTEFLCLLLKLLQLQPAEEVILSYMQAEEHKYLRVLGAVYYRFAFGSKAIFMTLEPLLTDFRKLRKRQKDGSFTLVRIDQVIWQLLREERVFDVILPRLTKRQVLEDTEGLEGRQPLIEMTAAEEESERNAVASVDDDHSAPNKQSAPTELLDEIEQENLLRAKLGLKPLQK